MSQGQAVRSRRRDIPTAPSAYRREARAGLMFVAPAMLVFTVVRIVPSAFSLYYSFTDYSLLNIPSFVGLENYRALLHDAAFWQAFRNTFVYMVGVTVPATALSFAVALMLNQRLRGRPALRTMYYLPVVASYIAVAATWSYLFNPNFGIVNYVLGGFGIEGPSWLKDPQTAMPAVIFVGIWKTLGFGTIIYLAALQAIPKQIYEAAAIDNLRGLRRFFTITWPLSLPTTMFVALLTSIESFQAFDQIYTLTAGGPVGATRTLVYEIYTQAFLRFQLGYACAMALVLFIVLFGLSYALLKVGRRDYEF